MDLGALMKNKKLVYGVGLAAAAGAAVLWQKNKSGTSSSGTSNSGTTSGTTYSGTGSVDTTGTDVASWLGSYSSSLQSQLSEYEKSLNSAVNGLGTMSNDTSSTDYRTIDVKSGTWLTEVLRNNNLTFADLVKYNPNIGSTLRESDAEGWVSTSNPVSGASERLSVYGDQSIKVPK